MIKVIKKYLGYILFYGFARYLPKPDCRLKLLGGKEDKINMWTFDVRFLQKKCKYM